MKTPTTTGKFPNGNIMKSPTPNDSPIISMHVLVQNPQVLTRYTCYPAREDQRGNACRCRHQNICQKGRPRKSSDLRVLDHAPGPSESLFGRYGIYGFQSGKMFTKPNEDALCLEFVFGMTSSKLWESWGEPQTLQNLKATIFRIFDCLSQP